MYVKIMLSIIAACMLAILAGDRTRVFSYPVSWRCMGQLDSTKYMDGSSTFPLGGYEVDILCDSKPDPYENLQ